MTYDYRAGYGNIDGFFSFSDSFYSVLEDVDLFQEFDWKNHIEIPYAGAAYFNVIDFPKDLPIANVAVKVSKVDVSTRNLSRASKPSSLALIGIALLTLGWRYRRSKHYLKCWICLSLRLLRRLWCLK